MRTILLISILLLPISAIFCQVKEKDQNMLDDSQLSLLEQAEIPYLKGGSDLIFEAKPSLDFDDSQWFTNDHTFITDKEGNLHWFGINNPYPPEGKYLYRYHPYLGHLTSNDATKNWKREKFAIDESTGTEYVGAPYVVWHEESERWVMVVETFLEGNRRMEVCWSDDLYNWERTYEAILPETLWLTARDPHIIKGEDGKYWIHLVSVDDSVSPTISQIVRLKTIDFVNFEEPQPIMGIADNVSWCGVESPFLIQRNNLWYLFFTYAHRRYTETIVVVSDNPNHFDYENNRVTTLFGHAAEIFEYKGITYISSCGPEDKNILNHQSVSLAELGWFRP
ncbi:MAG: hypothetical protein OXC03_06225 [Flavobacteriaceae bacterium]|nr:hypothetical protein [Flavobacteriaceae bacterium]